MTAPATVSWSSDAEGTPWLHLRLRLSQERVDAGDRPRPPRARRHAAAAASARPLARDDAGVELGRPHPRVRLARDTCRDESRSSALARRRGRPRPAGQAGNRLRPGADPDVPRAQRPAGERALSGAVRRSGRLRGPGRRGWPRTATSAVTLQRVFDSWRGAATLPAKPVVLSFDDGYLSDVRTALPVLKARHWPGVLNLEVANLKPVWGIRPPGVRKLLAAGWEIDAHTLTHPDLTQVDAATAARRGRRVARGDQQAVPRARELLLLPGGPVRRRRDRGRAAGRLPRRDDDELRAGKAGRAVHARARARRAAATGSRASRPS